MDDVEIVDSEEELKEYLLSHEYYTPQDIEIDYNDISSGVKLLLDKNNWEQLRVDCCNVLCEVDNQRKKPLPYGVTIRNYPGETRTVSSIRSKDNNCMVKIDCVVKTVRDPVQEIMYGRYRCKACDTPIPYIRMNHRIRIPTGCTCPMDEHHKGLYECPEEHIYRDVQKITVQDTVAPRGKQPKSIDVYLPSKFIEKLSPGNHCIITGLVQVVKDSDKSMFAVPYLDGYYVDKSEDDFTEVEITEEDIKVIHELAKDKDICKKLCDSINPEIYGYDGIKLALVVQMFGGVSLERSDGTRQRGDSHVLLVGDPSMAKSQLIRSVYNIVPRGMYASGKSTSGAGLTATAVKDENDKWTLEAGAMVLSDGGMCIIDELDKMNENDRSALHEAMEQQTISVNKAGMSEKLNTRCALLCAANPKEGKFQQDQDLDKQIDLPPALISRFDLIFSMIDVPDKETDRAVAKHILNMRSISEDSMDYRPVPIDIIRKYITYAKQYNPILSKEAKTYLEETYVNFRSNPSNYICTRQLQASIRLTESFARIRLSNVADLHDAKCAVNLYRDGLKSVTLSENVDVSAIMGVVSKEKLNIERCIHEILGIHKIPLNDLISSVQSSLGCDDTKKIRETIFRLRDIEKVRITENNIVSWV